MAVWLHAQGMQEQSHTTCYSVQVPAVSGSLGEACVLLIGRTEAVAPCNDKTNPPWVTMTGSVDKREVEAVTIGWFAG